MAPLFRGDSMNGEKPHSWFRHLEARFDDATPIRTKLYKFAKSLDPGRKAEKWFQALPAADTADWDLFYAAFTRKWPMPIVVEPSREELLARLRTTILKEEHLGVVMGDNDKVYSHVAWADEVRTLTDALEDGKGYFIPDVRLQIPLTLRRLLPGNLTTWTAFLTAVTAVSLDQLTDELENEDRLRCTVLTTLTGTGGNTYEKIPHLVCQFYRPSSSRRPVPSSIPFPNHSNMGSRPVMSELNSTLVSTPNPSSTQHISSDNTNIPPPFNISIPKTPPQLPQPDPPHKLRRWADDDDNWEPGQITSIFDVSTTMLDKEDVPTVYLTTSPAQRNLTDLQSTHPWGKIRRRNARLRQLRPPRRPFPTLVA